MKESQKSTAAIISKLGTSRTQYEIPLNWSINKYKCFLATQIPSLNFDQFEICYQQKLLRGTVKIFQMAEMARNDEPVQLQIIKAKSQTKLNQYYEANMKKFMENSAYQNQPILSNQYQKYLNLVSKEEKVEVQPQPLEERVEQDAELPLVLRILKYVGIFSLLKLVLSTSFKVIAIIGSIIIMYLILDAYVKNRHKKAKKIQNNGRLANTGKDSNSKKIQEMENGENGDNEEKPGNRRKGLILLYYYKIIEIVFCFFFTIFPNFTIDMHLQINKEKIQKARKSVNQLIPQAFEQLS